jgi:hypothetical protein
MTESVATVIKWPIYLFDESAKLPEKGNYYLIAGNGIFLHKDNGSFVALVPVGNISFLPDLTMSSFLKWNLPKIPSELIHQIKFFFAAVFEKYNAESVVNLFFDFTNKNWKVEVTKQYVSHGGVKYQRKAATSNSDETTKAQAAKTGINDLQRWVRIGTIHSHCDFNAYHSPTDVEDEEDFDGLHCTFGYVNKDDFTISASVVANGYRQKINPMIVMEGIQEKDNLYTLTGIDLNDDILKEWFFIIDAWLDQVEEIKPYASNYIVFTNPQNIMSPQEDIDDELLDDDESEYDVEFRYVENDDDELYDEGEYEWFDEDDEDEWS